MDFKIFIAYSNEDEEYANYILLSLSRIVEFSPYKAENFLDYGEDFKTRLEKILSDVAFMIVLLTSKGFHSQWVNQEVGYAYALKKRDGKWKNIPYIIPISDTKAKLKGFITKDSIDILFLDDAKKYPDFNYIMANIIFNIRSHIPGGLEEGTLKFMVRCSCFNKKHLPFEYKVKMPSQDTINEAIRSNRIYFLYECPQCHKQNYIDIRSFLPPIPKKE